MAENDSDNSHQGSDHSRDAAWSISKDGELVCFAFPLPPILLKSLMTPFCFHSSGINPWMLVELSDCR